MLPAPLSSPSSSPSSSIRFNRSNRFKFSCDVSGSFSGSSSAGPAAGAAAGAGPCPAGDGAGDGDGAGAAAGAGADAGSAAASAGTDISGPSSPTASNQCCFVFFLPFSSFLASARITEFSNNKALTHLWKSRALPFIPINLKNDIILDILKLL